MTDVRWQLAAYVFVSIILRIVAAQLNQRRTNIPWARRFSEGWAVSVWRFAYFIGLPYVALILGVLPARYLGLVGLNRLQARQSFPSGFEHLSEAARFLLPDEGVPFAGTGRLSSCSLELLSGSGLATGG